MTEKEKECIFVEKFNKITMKENSFPKMQYYLIREKELMIDLDVASIFEVEAEEIRRVVADYPLKFTDDFAITLTEKESEEIFTRWGKSPGNVLEGDKPVFAFSNLGIYMIGCLLHNEFSAFWSDRIVKTFAKLQTLSHLLSKVLEDPDMDVESKNHHLDRVNKLISEIFEATSLSEYSTDLSIMNIRKVRESDYLASAGTTAEA